MSRTGLVELNAVAAVASHRSFRAAAAELGMSPSALSHSIATLEQRLGVRLFNRTTRSVSLSAAGGQFLARVRPALREIEEAIEEAAELRDTPSGLLRLNTSDGAARVLMPTLLELVRRHPEIRLDLVTDDSLVDIVADGFDAGVRGRDQVPKDMVAVPFGRDVEFAVVGAPRYFKRRPPPQVPADLAKHDCIRRRWPSGAIYRWEFERRSRELAIDVSGTLTLDRDQLMIAAALDGAGLAYVSTWSVETELAKGKLVRVLADWTPAHPGLCLYYPGRRHLRASLRALIDVLRELDPPRR
jgi:DNA-binding transcriptional LysR family regulator